MSENQTPGAAAGNAGLDRRTTLKTGAASVVALAARPAGADASARRSADGLAYFERGDVRIRYREAGAGVPLLIIHGGGLNSRIEASEAPFDPTGEFRSDYRCITMDLRNAGGGQSTGPLDMDDPWGSHTADQLALLDHLGVDRFLVMGFCIGNPFIWNLLQRAPGRVVAAVSAQPSGILPGGGERLISTLMEGWAPTVVARRPDVTLETAQAYLVKMYRGAEFIATTTRDFVRSCDTPLLVLPDNLWAHPYEVAMEMVHLAPNAQVSLYPWKDSPQNVALALRHIRTFLKAYAPAVRG